MVAGWVIMQLVGFALRVCEVYFVCIVERYGLITGSLWE